MGGDTGMVEFGNVVALVSRISGTEATLAHLFTYTQGVSLPILHLGLFLPTQLLLAGYFWVWLYQPIITSDIP